MKFIAALALVTAATAVSVDTNAQRFARGLPPRAPTKRAPLPGAPPSTPSNTVSQCNTGPIHCCQSVQTAGQGGACDELIGLLGAVVPIGTNVGMNCSPITAIGVGSGAQCTQQPVCCENNNFNGLINVGCSPINIGL